MKFTNTLKFALSLTSSFTRAWQESSLTLYTGTIETHQGLHAAASVVELWILHKMTYDLMNNYSSWLLVAARQDVEDHTSGGRS
jgi:hypothetical protein